MIYTTKNTIDVGKPVKVFCNGVIVERCVYADTVNGVVEQFKKPYEVWPGGQLAVSHIFGKVTVEEIR